MNYERDLNMMVIKVVNLACLKSALLRDYDCFNPEIAHQIPLDNITDHTDLSELYKAQISFIDRRRAGLECKNHPVKLQ